MANEVYRVTAQFLNFRSAPVINSNNVITRLPFNQLVTLKETGTNWHRVTVDLNSQTLEGYVSTKWVALFQSDDILQLSTENLPPAVHITGNSNSRRNSTSHRHVRLNESDMPGVDPLQRAISIHQIVQYLDVENSARYRPEVFTYCNIYAYDFCCLTGAYLPRVWWREKALLALARQEPVDVVLDKTVGEMTANALFNWLKEWGDDYGWIRTYNLNDLQTEVNKGKAGLISAHHVDVHQHGHIVCVLPESGTQSANRIGGSVAIPLQSQAGRNNRMYFNNRAWWTRNDFRDFGFWYRRTCKSGI